MKILLLILLGLLILPGASSALEFDTGQVGDWPAVSDYVCDTHAKINMTYRHEIRADCSGLTDLPDGAVDYECSIIAHRWCQDSNGAYMFVDATHIHSGELWMKDMTTGIIVFSINIL